MSSEVLSQEEVDALLQGVSGDDEPAVAETAPEEGVRPYNLATQERIVRGRMPTLEIINDRFARLFRAGMFGFMRKSPEISVGPVKVQKYSEFMRNLVVPTNLNIVQAKPLRGNCLIVMEPMLIFTVIDHMFGGDSRFQARIEGRDFTVTEQRIIKRMLDVVLENYNKSWQPVHPMAFEHTRSEMHTQFASIATPSEVVITTSFSVELGSTGGAIHVAIPYATLEPIRDALYSGTRPDSGEPDTRWLHMLRRQVQDADVELTADLGHAGLTLGRVLGLRANEVIDVEIRPTVTATVDGIPLFECRYGVLNGRLAIKIERIVAGMQEEPLPGEKHV
ncbi:MAG: flagellar motor switch protein FliM [Burkholderiales bacterium]|nr:flagellar motor switch protein FliM [Burkholderiales bacterium]